MAISINSIESLQSYLTGVLTRANHHAENVEGVALALLGAVIWRTNGEIAVREYNGRPANMIWFHINDKKYLLTYNHEIAKIELKERTNTGNVITTFDNSSTYEEIIAEFGKL